MIDSLFIKKSKILLEIINGQFKLFIALINGQFKLFIAHYNIILLIIKNID